MAVSHHLNFGMRTQPTWSADTSDVGIKGHGRSTVASNRSTRDHFRPIVYKLRSRSAAKVDEYCELYARPNPHVLQ